MQQSKKKKKASGKTKTSNSAEVLVRTYKLTVIPNRNEIWPGLGQVKQSAVFCLLSFILQLLNKVNSN